MANVLPLRKPIDRAYVEDVVRRRRIRAFAASPPLVVPGDHPSIINADNTVQPWIEGGVNCPPEFWPDHFAEARGAVAWKPLIAGAFALLASAGLWWAQR